MPHRTARAVTARLAAQAGIRQIHLLDTADGIADDVDRLFAQTWRRVLTMLRRSGPTVLIDARHEFDSLYPSLVRLLIDRYRKLSRWSRAAYARSLAYTLPLDYLRAVSPVPPEVAKGVDRGLIREDVVRDLSGLVQLGRDPETGDLTYTDRTAMLREPSIASLSDDEARAIFERILFPPLPVHRVDQLLTGAGWRERIESLSRIASPTVLSGAVIQGYAAGENQQEIARRLLPMLDGVRASARRVARTAGMDIAHQSQMSAFDPIADMIAGYQVHAQLDQHTRPAHAARNGTVYWKQPEPGQLGMEECPQPPREADGSLAPNCRCHLTPMLRQPSHLRGRPLEFATDTGRVAPDPTVYSEWFERAPDRLRRKAVGVGRYEYIKQQSAGGSVVWSDFLDPTTGELVSLNRLKSESDAERAERRQAVDAAIARRRRLITTALNRGYVVPADDRNATIATVGSTT